MCTLKLSSTFSIMPQFSYLIHGDDTVCPADFHCEFTNLP